MSAPSPVPRGGATSVPDVSGLVQSIRHEDGTLDLYAYSLVSNLWTRTVTHLHEQSPSPVSGKTTRDVTTTNHRGEIVFSLDLRCRPSSGNITHARKGQ